MFVLARFCVEPIRQSESEKLGLLTLLILPKTILDEMFQKNLWSYFNTTCYIVLSTLDSHVLQLSDLLISAPSTCFLSWAIFVTSNEFQWKRTFPAFSIFTSCSHKLPPYGQLVHIARGCRLCFSTFEDLHTHTTVAITKFVSIYAVEKYHVEGGDLVLISALYLIA